MDDLGNRTTENVPDGNDVNYVVASLTNRYNKVGDANLAYDKAGNLTKDRQGYGYAYDYENRIVEINDVNGTAVAEFTYDCLCRRIEKKDLVDANNTRRYYYNNNWQVLAETDASRVLIERYECDAYRLPTIRDANTSLYDNPYLFTSR